MLSTEEFDISTCKIEGNVVVPIPPLPSLRSVAENAVRIWEEEYRILLAGGCITGNAQYEYMHRLKCALDGVPAPIYVHKAPERAPEPKPLTWMQRLGLRR